MRCITTTLGVWPLWNLFWSFGLSLTGTSNHDSKIRVCAGEMLKVWMAKTKMRLNWTTEVMVCTKVPQVRNPEWQFNLHYLAKCASLVWCLKLWHCLQDIGCERCISQLKYTSVSSMVSLSACDRMCGGLLWFQYNFHPAHTASHETTHAHERKFIKSCQHSSRSCYSRHFLHWFYLWPYAVKLTNPQWLPFCCPECRRMKWSK